MALSSGGKTIYNKEKTVDDLLKNVREIEFPGQLIPYDYVCLLISRFSKDSTTILTEIIKHNYLVLEGEKKKQLNYKKAIDNLVDIRNSSFSSPEKINNDSEGVIDTQRLVFPKQVDDACEEILSWCVNSQEVLEYLSDINNNIKRYIKLWMLREFKCLKAEKPKDLVSLERYERVKMILSTFSIQSREVITVAEEKPNVILLKDHRGKCEIIDFFKNTPSYAFIFKDSIEKLYAGSAVKDDNSGSTRKLFGFAPLCEVKDTNGARLLYVDMGNNTFVLVLAFLKTDDTSVKTTGKYQRALDIYNLSLNQILQNMYDPDFVEEQLSLKNELFSCLGIADSEVMNSGWGM